MAISSQCKFEFKANVDRVQKEKKISRNKAIAILADELGLMVETARKQDKRARDELGQNVPQKSKTPENTAPYEPREGSVVHPPTDRGGKREGAGRPRKDPEPDKPIWSGLGTHWATIAISQLSRIEADDPQKDEAFDMVVSWIEKNR